MLTVYELMRKEREGTLTEEDLKNEICSEDIRTQDPEKLRFAATHAKDAETLNDVVKRAISYRDNAEGDKDLVNASVEDIMLIVTNNPYAGNEALAACLGAQDNTILGNITCSRGATQHTRDDAMDQLITRGTANSLYCAMNYPEATPAMLSRIVSGMEKIIQKDPEFAWVSTLAEKLSHHPNYEKMSIVDKGRNAQIKNYKPERSKDAPSHTKKKDGPII